MWGGLGLEVFSQNDFMRYALVTGLIVGALCGYLGVYVVLKRIVFVGVALDEISYAGLALSLWVDAKFGMVVDEHSPLNLLGALAAMLVGVLLFSLRWSSRKVPHESTIGIGYAIAGAGALLLMAHNARGEAHMMDLLFGNILTVSSHDIEELAIAAAVVGLIHLLFAKEFLFVAFDPESAAAMGYRTRRWEILFYLTLGLTIAFAIRVSGVLLVFALLVMPAVTALMLTRRIKTAFATSAVVGMLPVGVGLWLSFVKDLPSAATIVLLSFVLMLAAGGVSLVRRTA